jgi:hypothetical protein
MEPNEVLLKNEVLISIANINWNTKLWNQWPSSIHEHEKKLDTESYESNKTIWEEQSTEKKFLQNIRD